MKFNDDEEIEVGDTITFSCLIAWRPFRSRVKVRDIEDNQRIIVHSNGCKDFVVRLGEVTGLKKKETGEE